MEATFLPRRLWLQGHGAFGNVGPEVFLAIFAEGRLDRSESWGMGSVGFSGKLRLKQKAYSVILFVGRVTKGSESTFLPSGAQPVTVIGLWVVSKLPDCLGSPPRLGIHTNRV